MRKFLFASTVCLAGLFCSLAFASPQEKSDKCLTCHQAIGDRPSELFANDVHRQRGISCAGCHGGDPGKEEMEDGMSKSAGFIGVPKGDEITAACATCHANASVMVKKYNSDLPQDQAELLSASVHGKLSTTGKERIVQCTTCHGSHGIVRVTNPRSPVYPLNAPKTCASCHSNPTYIRSFNPALPVDQLEKYRTSIHGLRNAKGDVNVAECASCHGSHEILPAKDVKSKVYATNLPSTCAACHANAAYMKEYHLPSDQYAKFAKSVHGVALLEKKDLGAPSCNDCHGNHGAAPPGVESISKVCGTCHALNASLFASSPHKTAFDKRKLPECETCHSNHEIYAAKEQLLGVSEGAVCAWCHQENKLPRGFAVAKTMRKLVDSLGAAETHSISLIEEAEQKGMEVSDAKFQLRAVHQARLESRTMVHSFNENQFREVVDKGLAEATAVSDQSADAIREYYFRRWGVGVSTLIITVLAVSLYITIRRIEKKQAVK